MSERHTIDSEALTRWLDAEREEQSAEAEAALAALFQDLPSRSPRSGFAHRVMVEATREPVVAETTRRWAVRWTPLVAAAFGIALAWVLLWLPFVLRALRDLWSPAELCENAASKVVALHLWLSPVLAGMRQVAVLWQSLTGPLQSTPMQVLAGLCVVVAAVAFGVLRELVLIDRRWVYVDPI
jgi:hypothetical protein